MRCTVHVAAWPIWEITKGGLSSGITQLICVHMVHSVPVCRCGVWQRGWESGKGRECVLKSEKKIGSIGGRLKEMLWKTMRNDSSSLEKFDSQKNNIVSCIAQDEPFRCFKYKKKKKKTGQCKQYQMVPYYTESNLVFILLRCTLGRQKFIGIIKLGMHSLRSTLEKKIIAGGWSRCTVNCALFLS